MTPAHRIAGWLAATWRRTTLRTRLVGLVLLLVAAALATTGVVAAATLRGYLVQRVDAQLTSTAQDFARHGLGPPTNGVDRGGGDRDQVPTSYVVEVLDNSGNVIRAPSTGFGPAGAVELPALTANEVAERHGAPFTVHEPDGTQWRVVAAALADGGGSLLVAQNLGEVGRTVSRLELLEGVIGLAALALIGVVGTWLLRASLRPLREVEDTAAAIAAGDLTQRIDVGDPRTEMGRLSGSLNAMLAQIEAAFAERAASEQQARTSEERMRRFVADASHELRTPLTSIRGFAELHRQGAIPDSAGVARAMQRIEGEAQRMGLLVDDLLLLARLDQERPLAQDPVDLLTLASDAVHDAQASDPGRPIALELGPLEPPPVVLGDDARLRQVLANLLSNALRHTPAGTPVTVRLRTEPAAAGEVGGRVEIEVADRGPGLSPQAAERAFERFYRADPSRNRVDGGAGLGLAIVHALVVAHRGEVTVETAPGAGATFRVRLPLRREP